MQEADEVAKAASAQTLSLFYVWFRNGAVITALLRLGLSESEAPSFKRS